MTGSADAAAASDDWQWEGAEIATPDCQSAPG
jgi:hypothetical protein